MSCASAATVLIRRIAPEFAAVTDAEVDSWVEIAEAQHTTTVFGNLATQAMARYAAHLMTRAGLGSAAAGSGGASTVGTVSSVREGDLAVTYDGGAIAAAAGRLSVGDADLATTRHGLAYLAIRNSRPTIGIGYYGPG